jgi:peptidyl-prolyl cis-trans isomerase C
MRKLLTLSLCAALGACSGAGTGDNRIVQLPANLPVAETVNGTAVPQALVDAFVRVKAPKADMSNPEQRAEILRVLADYVLLAEQAKRDNLQGTDSAVAADVEVARLAALANATMLRLQQQTPLTDEALKGDYEAKLAKYPKVDFDFSSLLFDNEDAAIKASGELVAGKPFAQVYDAFKGQAKEAKVYTHVAATKLPDALGQAIAQMKEGDFLKVPVKSQFGWHVVHLDAINAVTPPTFDQVKDEIRAGLQKKIGEERLAKIKQQATIEYPPGSVAAAAPGAAGAAKTPAPAQPATAPAAPSTPPKG